MIEGTVSTPRIMDLEVGALDPLRCGGALDFALAWRVRARDACAAAGANFRDRRRLWRRSEFSWAVDPLLESMV
jgi:hypothetical protein